MNKHHPIGHVSGSTLMREFRSQLDADTKAVIAFQDKCFADMIEQRRTGKVNTHFDGFISRMKSQGTDNILSNIDDLSKRRRSR